MSGFVLSREDAHPFCPFHHMSLKRLQKNVDEFCFGYNHSTGNTAMFTNFLFQLKKAFG